MKQLYQNYYQQTIPKALHNLSFNAIHSAHIDTSLLNSKHNLTQKKSIELIVYILKSLMDRNYDKKKFKQDFYFAKPLFIALSPNNYNPNDINYWPSTEGFSLTQMILALETMQYFNMIVIKKGHWFKEYKIIRNPITEEFEEIEIIDSEQTKIFLNPIELWDKNKIINYKTNKPYTWFDIWYAFLPDINTKKWNCINRKKIKDEKDHVIKKIDSQASSEECKKVERINKHLIEKGYPNLIYKRIFGSCEYDYGRFYSPFQNIPKELRKLICEEQDWKELDFSASNPNLIWMLETGTKFKGDIYTFIGNHIEMKNYMRPIIKDIVLPLFATASREGKKGAETSLRKILVDNGIYINNDFNTPILIENVKDYLNNLSKEYNEKHIDKKQKDYYNQKKWAFKNFLIKNNLPLDTPHYLYSPSFILNKIENIPEFKNYLYSNSSAKLQHIESEICFNIMLKQIQLNELSLSIHDSFITKHNAIISYYMEYIRFIVTLKYTKNYSKLLKDLLYFIINNKRTNNKQNNNNLSIYNRIMKYRDNRCGMMYLFDFG